MPNEKVTIRTLDGDCPSTVFTPPGKGPWPAIIIYMDAAGIRPTLHDMAQRLADAGYVALVPDMFYRFGSYGPLVPAELFKGDFRAVVGPMMATTGNDKAASDTAGFLAYLDTRPDVAGKVGAVGFCMGGGMAITVAGTYPDRFGAAASFHGGNLYTDLPTSPHLVAPKLKAEIYVAGADNDRSYPLEMEAQLKTAFDSAGVKYKAEIYSGAAHGWMKPDFPVYDEAAAERGWTEMLALFDRNLRT